MNIGVFLFDGKVLAPELQRRIHGPSMLMDASRASTSVGWSTLGGQVLKITHLGVWMVIGWSCDLRNTLKSSEDVFLMLRRRSRVEFIDILNPSNVQDFSKEKCHALERKTMDFQCSVDFRCRSWSPRSEN